MWVEKYNSIQELNEAITNLNEGEQWEAYEIKGEISNLPLFQTAKATHF